MDIVATLIAITLTATGILAMLGAPTRRTEPAIAYGVFALASIAMAARRDQAYHQPTPWLVAAFAASAVAAAATIPWWLSFTLVAMIVAGVSALLLIGFVLRPKAISERISLSDVGRLLLVMGGACIGIVACENFLRFGAGLLPYDLVQSIRNDPRNYGIAHSYIGHLHKPNNSFLISSGKDFSVVHHTGEYGFRNPSPWPYRSDMVVLGDSLTFGYGVEDNRAWPSILGQSLAPTRVLNLGLIGGGPQQYLRVYQTFGIEQSPKLVIVGFFGGNDFSNAGQFDRWLQSGAGGNYMVWRDFGQPNRVPFSLRRFRPGLESLAVTNVYPLLRRSYLFNLLRFTANAGGARKVTEATVFRTSDGRAIQLSKEDLETEAVLGKRNAREFELTVDALTAIQLIAKEHHAHTLIVLQPSKEEVYLPLLGVDTPDVTGPLREALARRGVEYLDMTPAFRASAASGAQLFFEVDGHPNEAGYALIADNVAAYVRRNSALDDVK